jgi:hypothetical protein
VISSPRSCARNYSKEGILIMLRPLFVPRYPEILAPRRCYSYKRHHAFFPLTVRRGPLEAARPRLAMAVQGSMQRSIPQTVIPQEPGRRWPWATATRVVLSETRYTTL